MSPRPVSLKFFQMHSGAVATSRASKIDTSIREKAPSGIAAVAFLHRNRRSGHNIDPRRSKHASRTSPSGAAVSPAQEIKVGQ
jgi:hypothetical protein